MGNTARFNEALISLIWRALCGERIIIVSSNCMRKGIQKNILHLVDEKLIRGNNQNKITFFSEGVFYFVTATDAASLRGFYADDYLVSPEIELSDNARRVLDVMTVFGVRKRIFN